MKIKIKPILFSHKETFKHVSVPFGMPSVENKFSLAGNE